MSLLYLILALAAFTYALPINTKRSSLTGDSGLTKDLEIKDGPLEDVSRVLERYARQISGSSKGSANWSSLHRNVLRGALQVTKQLLSYEGWTPNHLELLKGEQDTLSELVAVEGNAADEGAGPVNNAVENKEGPVNNEGITKNEEIPSPNPAAIENP